MNLGIRNGAYSAFVTPFHDDGETINKTSVRDLIEFQISSGIDGLYVSGSTGEAMVLPDSIRMEMAELAVEYVDGRVPVIVHVGTPDTRSAVKFAKHAQSIGADGISAVPPYYYRMTRETIQKHYTAIADACDLPFLLYNIPNLTGVTLDDSFIVEMANHPNIVGCKFTDTNLEGLRKIKAVDDGRVKVFMGVDALLLSGLVLGANGGIGTFYNVMPGALSGICHAYWNNDWETARALQWQVCRYITIMKKYIGVGLFTGVKTILKEIGIDCGKTTPPLPQLDDETAARMIAELRKEGFFEFIQK